jgi:FlaA1/EpsC-like NDP-sugar epimerase
MCADALSLSIAMVLSLFLRFDGMYNNLEPGHQHVIVRYIYPVWPELLVALCLYLVCFAAFRLYRYAWRFASLEMIWGVVFANNLGLFALVLMMKLTGKLAQTGFPRGVFIIFWVLSIIMVGGMRILLRLANMSRTQGRRALSMIRRDTRPKRVIILGGGSDGARVLSALHEDATEVYDVIGFLDDRPAKRGIYIRGVRVLGPLNHLYKLLAEAAVDEVLIAIPDGSAALHDYVLACRRKQIPVKVIPGLTDVLTHKAHARLEEISIEDLLRRPPVCIDLTGIGHYLTGKRVMITGAGGSIGSELCRQIAALEPEALILFGHGENSVHGIQQELQVSHPGLAAGRLHMAIGSVADDVRVDQIFQQYRPQVVFHAAAHKHVPIMELNVPEAVQNNVMGTRCIADACGRFGVEHMVLISTDKAANPSSVMGATKWLCEQVLRALAEGYPHTSYVTVRFGNVLGSRGSVVPIFREQIRRGGPVTITHPEVTRFFMTIPEAVQLVLQAGAIGNSGELYLLDMGVPVKIVDLARDMIRLSGLEPDVDVKIQFTGLRPGEKLHEVLTNEEEILEPASSEGLSIVHRGSVFTPTEFKGVLRRLQQLVSGGDTDELLRYLVETVPGFANQRLFSEALDNGAKPAALPSSQQ